jgi:hypothetical protein
MCLARGSTQIGLFVENSATLVRRIFRCKPIPMVTRLRGHYDWSFRIEYC